MIVKVVGKIWIKKTEKEINNIIIMGRNNNSDRIYKWT